MWFFGLIVVLLIGAVAVVASGRWGAMSTAYDDRPDMTVPARQALSSADIESARFAVGLRGYRMDEVDTLLERVAKEVAERDRRIADLERAVAPIVEAPDGAGFTSRSRYSAADFDDTGMQKPIMVGGDFPEPDTSEQPSVTAEHPVVPPEPSVASPEPSDVSSEQASASPGQPGESPEQAAGGGQQPGAAAQAGGAQTAAGPVAGAQPASAAQPPTLQQPVADDDEFVTAEQPVTTEQTLAERSAASHAAADEYERLQAEARALLEAQSQPGPPRRTPAERQPARQQATPPRQSDTPAPEPQQPESYEPEGEAWYQRPAPEQPPADGSQPGPQRSVPAAGPQPAPTPHWVLPDPAPQHEESAPPEQGAYQRPS
jgi:DivIVA domain-containing protein